MTQKKNGIWMIACVFIAGLTIWAVVTQSESFSFEEFLTMLKTADRMIVGLCLVLMVGIILSESAAVRCILKPLASGWKKERNSVFYASADIYFSAITPSASGGQPMMAWFMKKDGISAAVITASLILNLILYTIALFVVGFISWLLNPSFILCFSAFSKTLIFIGFLFVLILIVGFALLLFRPEVMQKILNGGLKLLNKLIHFKNPEAKQKKIDNMLSEYQDCAQIIAGNKKMVWLAFLWNFLMRLCQTFISPLIYLSAGGVISQVTKIWQVQVFSYVGSYVLPIPGGMGAADYILINGFSQISEVASASGLALMSRGIAFYFTVILSGLIVLIGYLKKKHEKTVV